jgi:hypothetical protein
MQITPLYRHAAMRIPALTALFSDLFDVTEIDVVKDGTTTLTCAAPHGVKIGAAATIAITDAPFPNPIVATERLANGDWILTTEFDHDLTTTPSLDIAEPWDLSADLAGFTDAAMNGALQLVSVPDRFTLIVRPSTSPADITLNGNEVQKRSLEFEMVGWHKVIAATANTLTFPTPATVLRSYTVTTPTVVRNIRIFGAVNLDAVMKHYVRSDAETAAHEITMFIAPLDSTRVRPRARGGVTALGPSQAVHFGVEDGFRVVVLIPSEASTSGVAALDLAQGPILRAILRTFNGLRLPREEFPASAPYSAILEEHGAVRHDGATYVHEYSFSASVDMTDNDRIQPWEAADLAAAAIGATSVTRVGAPAYRELHFTGLRHSSKPGILEALIELDSA